MSQLCFFFFLVVCCAGGCSAVFEPSVMFRQGTLHAGLMIARRSCMVTFLQEHSFTTITSIYIANHTTIGAIRAEVTT